MIEDLRSKAQKLADTLRQGGHPHYAAALSNLLSDNLVGGALLTALKAMCDTLLTVVEAIDPVSEMELERVRLAIDHLTTPKKSSH